MIGYVDGSTPATTRRFHVVLNDDSVCELDDLIVTRQTLPDGSALAHYAIVVEGMGQLEGASYPSDTLRISQRTMPGEPSRRVEAQVLRIVSAEAGRERWIAPHPGSMVELVGSEHDRNMALFVDQMASRLPIGLDQHDQPVYADLTFINGERGGHVSISGVSGVATKTSYALFLLYMMFETPVGLEALGMDAVDAKALVFNVKGEDLMHIDRANRLYAQRPNEAARWQALGVEAPGLFTDVSFFAPRSRDALPGMRQTDTISRPMAEMTVYGWTPFDFLRNRLLRYALADAQDARSQISFLEQRISSLLASHAFSVANMPGAAVLVQNETVNPHTDREHLPGDGDVIADFSDLVDWIGDRLTDRSHADHQLLVGPIAEGTALAFLRRLEALRARIGHLISTTATSISLECRINVVDIHNLHDDAQRFVVGAVVSTVFEEKQHTGRQPLRFIVLDELNKYAPRDGTTAVKDIFVDIAARGRSLGVILIGAQQNTAGVDKAITAAAALKVVGRLDASSADDYKFLSSELRERATRFLPGTMIVDQPLIPAPLPVRFPFPPYASNQTDAVRDVDENIMEVLDRL